MARRRRQIACRYRCGGCRARPILRAAIRRPLRHTSPGTTPAPAQATSIPTVEAPPLDLVEEIVIPRTPAGMPAVRHHDQSGVVPGDTASVGAARGGRGADVRAGDRAEPARHALADKSRAAVIARRQRAAFAALRTHAVRAAARRRHARSAAAVPWLRSVGADRRRAVAGTG